MVRACRRHLDEIDESYWQHLRAALRFSRRLAGASAACALHAFIPGLCTRSASRTVAELHAELGARSPALAQLERIERGLAAKSS